MTHAKITYRFIAQLEQDDVLLPVVIANDEAEQFLPALPPLSTTDNPNEAKRLMERLTANDATVENRLLGPKQDGEWSRPIIDWTLEAVEVDIKGKQEKVRIMRVFGMQEKR